ncbi:MAG: exodeoxyribonuclease V subunit beta [Oleispira sp.]|nr:exodeoxyribonuclease V subunit beta [Oleispira sp.]
MKILQADSFPLLGKRLIEASAGTGKTYTIANLYLRLLLADFQLEQQLEQESGLSLQPVDRILVVTFTRAATEELRGRIRDRIRELYEDVLRLEQDPDDELGQIDPYIKALILRTQDNFHSDDPYSQKQSKQLKLTDWLQANLAQMDESSVFTIHGFCQRILKQFAFDSGVGFESEMILDAQDYLKRAAQDYWRELAYPMEQEQLSALLGQISSPEDVFWKVRGWLQQDDIELLPKAKSDIDFSTAWQQAKASYDSAVKVWQGLTAQDLNDLIENSGVDKRSFSKSTRPKRIAAAKAFFTVSTFFNGKIPKDVLELGQENLFIKTKKGAAPEHQGFCLIDQLAADCEQMSAVLPHHMLAQVKTKFWVSMEQANLMNPDDLLRLLANALRGSHGEALAEHIRRQYPFAMIDEFQDTDSLQYEIFNQVYQDNQDQSSEKKISGLYMIGDPKQAIYSFRGADIFTYLQAGKLLDEDSRFTLNTNWRSHSDLVAATNELFSRHPEPFVLPGKIEFQSVLAAGRSDKGYFHYRGEEKCPPLNFLLNSEGTNRDKGRYNAAEMCANSIQKILLKGCLQKKGEEKSVDAGDIAVLVHNRKQAKLVKDNLKKLGINSVFLSRDSVLNSIEARDLLRWLTAIAEPQNERLLRNALACESLDYDAQYLASLLEDEVRWEAELTQLYLLRDRFNQRGVMAFLMAWLEMKPCLDPSLESSGQGQSFAIRLRKQADGERKLTNFLHLGEVLQQASRELGIQSGFYNTDGKGLLTLLRWYSERCQNALLNKSEEQQIRLESDANLVQIVTIHKSKGLQYPIVFLPFCWDEDNNSVRFDALYHTEKSDPSSGGEPRSVLTINTKPDSDAKKKHVAEVRAEAMRLLYVALTRAEQACFIQLENIVKHLKAGPKGLLLNSAIGYLLEQESVSIDALKERFSEIVDDGKLSLNYYSDWLEEVEKIPSLPQAKVEDVPALEAAQFRGKVWDNWRLTSYSQLAKIDSDYVQSASEMHAENNSLGDLSLDSGSHFDSEAELLTTTNDNSAIEIESESGEIAKSEALTVFDFPKGATPGTCLHGILENWDFVDEEQLKEQAEQQLKFYGIDEEFNPLLNEWMKQVVTQPLADAGCCLADVSEKNRLVEMEFYLPMTEIRASGVMPLLDGRRLAFEPMRGQLKGFIDLIFRHDNRYYVADYKSNYLGDQISDYQPESLIEAMEHHQYDLQYWIYTIAVDQYLSRRIPNYDYDTHFGGVYYLFLRGMNGKSDGEGVFFTRPEKSQLEKWRHWLLGTELDEKMPQQDADESQQMGLF